MIQLVAFIVILSNLSPIAQQNEMPSEVIAAFDSPAEIDDQTILPEQEIREFEVEELIEEIQPAVPELPPLLEKIQAIQPNADLVRIRGLEVTQGIQVFNEPQHPNCRTDVNHPDYIFCNNSIPLVAGRHTMVRLYVGCNLDCPSRDMTVRINVIKQGEIREVLTGQLTAHSLAQLNQFSLSEVRHNLANSLNFSLIPAPAWLSDEVTFEVQIETEGTSLASLVSTHKFEHRKPLRIAYLPIKHQGLSPAEVAGTEHWLLRMYPVPAVEYFRLPVPELVWNRELNKAELLQELLYTYWLYAEHHPAEEWPDQLFGWLPQEAYNGGASDPDWCPNCAGPHSSRVAFGGMRPEQDIGGPRILVHEIAHNLGARHAWSPTQREDAGCFKAEGADIRVDPEWPYAETPYIQEFGVDLYNDPPVIYSPSAYDMMAYCTFPWISPHTYRKIFESPILQADASGAAFRPRQTGQNGGPTLMIKGSINADGTVSRPEVVQIEQGIGSTMAPGSATTGDYCLNVFGSGEEILARRCFKAGFIDVETGLPLDVSPYFVSLAGLTLKDVSKITLDHEAQTVVSLSPSATAPQVSLTFPNGGETLRGQQTLTWQASDADGDSLTFDLLYSPDGGERWLPLATGLSQTRYTLDTTALTESDNTLIRVVASDGFHTSVDGSDEVFSLESTR
ncbi:MAG: hypothetical protein R3264_01070 [Anaerolineae bacterium]|nr:hypothetical protein [Anaerolineae bacterium]